MFFLTVLLRFAEKEDMENCIETAYEDFCIDALSCRGKQAGSRNLENMLYERLGMSSDEIRDIISADDVVVMSNII